MQFSRYAETPIAKAGTNESECRIQDVKVLGNSLFAFLNNPCTAKTKSKELKNRI